MLFLAARNCRQPKPKARAHGSKIRIASIVVRNHCCEDRKSMTGPEVLDVAKDSIFTLVVVASPLMLVGLGVGVAISLFQALTQIQEMTLVFVPKILAIFVAMLLALPFMADALQGHMARIASRIIGG